MGWSMYTLPMPLHADHGVYAHSTITTPFHTSGEHGLSLCMQGVVMVPLCS